VLGGVKHYRKSKVTFEYLVERLGVTENIALEILNNKKALTLDARGRNQSACTSLGKNIGI
jgi:plasmid maintenance system antidote protein VapI